jgi:hypothetical protein
MNPAIVTVRIMQFAFIVSVLLFFRVLHIVQPAPQGVSATVQWCIVCCAIATALLGFVGQRAFRRAPSPLVPETQRSTVRSRWFAGHLLRFATAESVAMFGIVLHALGSPTNLVDAMFAGSLLLLVVWQPGEAPAATESQNPIR